MHYFSLMTLICLVLLVSGCGRPSTLQDDNIQNHQNMDISEKHCKMMPDMPGCEIYKNQKISHSGSSDQTPSSDVAHHMDHGAMVTDILSFVSEMIPHHQEAVDASMLVLSQTFNPQLKPILQNIINAQNKEITMMKAWLETYFSGQDYKTQYMLMMRPLQHLTGGELDKVYMQDMIVHHQGAIDMAHKILSLMAEEDPKIRVTEQMAHFRSEIKSFAQTIIDTQTQEIKQFENLLKQTI